MSNELWVHVKHFGGSIGKAFEMLPRIWSNSFVKVRRLTDSGYVVTREDVLDLGAYVHQKNEAYVKVT